MFIELSCSSWPAPRLLSQLSFTSASDLGDIRHNFLIAIEKPAPLKYVFACQIGRRDQSQVSLKFAAKPGQVAHSSRYVLFDIATVPHSQTCGGLRHQLHETCCALAGDRTRTPARLLSNNRAHKTDRQAVVPRVFGHVVCGLAVVTCSRGLGVTAQNAAGKQHGV